MAEGVELATAWVRLVPSLEGVGAEITKQFAPGAKAADEEGQKAGKRFGAGAKAGMIGAGIGAGIAAAFKGLYEVGDTFDAVTDTIRTGTGAQGEALEGLTDVAKNVGQTVPAEFEAIGTTVSDLNTRLGLSGDTLETVASQYLEAGRILGEEVDVKGTTAAFSAFKIEGDAVSGAMDTLFQVSQATGVGMNDLAAGVQKTAPALQALGFGFEESVSLLGSLDKAGLNSQQVMGSLSKGLVTLAKDGEEPQDAFARVTGELQGFIKEGDTAGALNLASKVFGTKGATQFIGALQSGVLNMDDLMAATGATGDTILGVGEETMDFAEKWQVTLNKAMVALEPLATTVFTAVGDGLTNVMPMLEDFGAWLGQNTQVIAIFAAVIGVTLVAAFIAWAASIWASTVALLANPITWIILAIVALIAIIVLLVMNWDTVVAFLTDVWQGFVDWFTGVMDGFLAWWNGMWTAVWEWIVSVWNGIVSWVTTTFNMFLLGLQIIGAAIAAWWNGLWQGVSDFLAGIWNGIVGFVTAYINTVRTIITTVVNAVKATWNNVWSGISTFFKGIWGNIVNAVKGFKAIFEGVFSGISGFVTTAFNGVLGAVKGPINGIIGIVNSAIGALNGLSVTIPDWVPVVGGQTWGLSLPTIPKLAMGATIMPSAGGTLALLAEAGKPETVVDTGLHNRLMEQALEGGPGGNVYVQNPFTGEYLLAQVDDRADGRIERNSRIRSTRFSTGKQR